MRYIMAKDYRGLEQRKYQRAKKVIFILCEPSGTEEPIECIAKNIGAGGLMFEADTPFSIGAKLDIEIYQPTTYDKRKFVSIFASASVVWVKEIEVAKKYKGSNRYRLGVQFTRLDQEDRIKIDTYVKEWQNALRQKQTSCRDLRCPFYQETKGGVKVCYYLWHHRSRVGSVTAETEQKFCLTTDNYHRCSVYKKYIRGERGL